MSAPVHDDAEVAQTFDPRALPAAFYADPYPVYAALRRHSPIHRCPDGTVFLTRHQDLNRVYRDPKTFSSAKEQQFRPLFGDSPLFEHHTTSLVFNDPPLHTQVRKAIGDALAPRVVRDMESGLVRLVDGLLDKLETRNHFDLMADYASVIPIEVIGNLMDIAPADRTPLRDWSAAILGALEFGLDEQARAAGNRAVTEFVEFLREVIAARRAAPTGMDIISRMLRFETPTFRLSDAQIYHQCIFLLNAGHETTTNLIGNGVHALLLNETARRALREEPALMPGAVEEFLRFDAPVQLGNRITTVETALDAEVLSAGTTLTLCIGAANRDPAVFAAPDVLDVRRQPNPQLAFGGGIHACAGMALARLEARIAIERLLARFPHLMPAGTPKRAQRARFRGFLTLPLAIR